MAPIKAKAFTTMSQMVKWHATLIPKSVIKPNMHPMFFMWFLWLSFGERQRP